MSEKVSTHITMEYYIYSKLLAQKRNKYNTLNAIKSAYDVNSNIGKLKLSELYVTLLKTSINDENTFFDVVDNGYKNEYNNTLYSIVWNVEKTKDNEGNEIINNILLNGLNVVNSQLQDSDIPNTPNYYTELSYKLLELTPNTFEEFMGKYNHYQLMIIPQLNSSDKTRLIDVCTKVTYIHSLSLFAQYQYYVYLDNTDNIDLLSKTIKKVCKEIGIKDKYINAAECCFNDSIIPLLTPELITTLKSEISKGYSDVVSRKGKGKKSTFTQKPTIIKTEEQKTNEGEN